MTVIATESFDVKNPSGAMDTKWSVSGSSLIAGRTGANALSAAGTGASGNCNLHLGPAEQHATMIFGFAYNNSFSYQSDLMQFWGSSGVDQLVTIRLNSTGGLSAYRGSTSGTLLGTTATNPIAMGTGTWYFIECKVTISASVGEVTIHVDGTEVLHLTGQNTKPTSATVIDHVAGLLKANSAMDDVYLLNGAGSANNDFLVTAGYTVHVEALLPSGDGNSSQWVGSDGNSTNNSLLVDEATVDTADYVETDTTNNKDTYALADSAYATSLGVVAVVAYAYAEKLDAGARTLDLVVRQGGSETAVTSKKANDFAGTTSLTNGSYQWMRSVFETKPTGGAWSVSDVNGAESGPKAT